MNILLLGLLAETSVHPGTGQSVDIIDLPVAREAATGYPVITGSSFKGALADYARDLQSCDKNKKVECYNDKTKFDCGCDCKRVFGKQDDAGALLVSDARLLLLPVRSLTSAYKWVTCPHLLERWQRDSGRGGIALPELQFAVETGRYLGYGNQQLFLEERQFAPVAGSKEKLAQLDAVFTSLIEAIKPLIKHEETRKRLMNQLVVISDDDFAWFARNGLGVQARNLLDEDTKTSNNLWYEEYIPADALFYAVLVERKPGAIVAIEPLLRQQPYIQLGGNETVGAGWFALSVIGGENATNP